METTYKVVDGKIEETTTVVKTYSLKKLKEQKDELKLKKAMLENKINEIQADINSVQILIDQFKALNIVE